MIPGASGQTRWRLPYERRVYLSRQGSQSPGMLHHLLNHPAVVRTLDQISEVLHSDVRNLDGEQALEFDVSVQLALFAAGVATANALMEQDVQPAAVSGLSVGAFLRFEVVDSPDVRCRMVPSSART
jgi:malonyl CoA-acyl carrier protein transacylase